MQEEAAVRAAEVGVNQEALARCGDCTAVEGMQEWMWEWRDWRVVVHGEPCPGCLEYKMDFATGTSRARLCARLRERLDEADVAGGGAADGRPLAPFPPQPESPPAVAAAGDPEEEVDVAAEDVEEEMEYGPSDSTLALIYEDDTRYDIYVGMDTDPRTCHCCTCPPRCRPLLGEFGTAALQLLAGRGCPPAPPLERLEASGDVAGGCLGAQRVPASGGGCPGEGLGRLGGRSGSWITTWMMCGRLSRRNTSRWHCT